MSAIDDVGEATTLRLGLFNEEIHVYLRDGALLTDHRFFSGNVRFLKLHYTIRRAASQT